MDITSVEVAHMLVSLLKRLKTGTDHLNYGRDIIAGWGANVLDGIEQPRIMDIGAGTGNDLMGIARRVDAVELFGIDCYQPNQEQLQNKGIHAVGLDIERDAIPFPDGFFHLAIANQVLEHVKEVFWVLSEMARVVKPGGHVIVGVPNLASLHNRIALLLGLQPTCINLISAHVRGFTSHNAEQLFTLGGFFQIIGYTGSNFYPLPPAISRPLSRWLPSMAVSSFYLLQRTALAGSYIDTIKPMRLETPFYTGEISPR